MIFGLTVRWNKTEIYFRWREDIYLLSVGRKIYIYYQVVGRYIFIIRWWEDMTQLLLLGKFEYTGGPIFKVVLEC